MVSKCAFCLNLMNMALNHAYDLYNSCAICNIELLSTNAGPYRIVGIPHKLHIPPSVPNPDSMTMTFKQSIYGTQEC